jgi:hypothetical protein
MGWYNHDLADTLGNPLIEGCQCAACVALRLDLTTPAGLFDQRLGRLYGRKLLVRFWAGKPTRHEKAYQHAHAPWAIAAVERGRELAAAHPENTERFKRRLAAKRAEATDTPNG